MNELELVLLEKNQYISYLSKLQDFNILGDDDFALKLKEQFKSLQNSSSKNIVITNEDLQRKEFFDKVEGKIIALKGEYYYKNHPLSLISIPKAGTHLLYNLVNAFGYKFRHKTPENPEGGYWYFLEYSHSHTEAKRFFNDSVYINDHGNRAHPFTTSPSIFIYRHPLDILVSEANYYHKEGKTLFSNYLKNFDFSDRLKKLINDKWILNTLEDRISKYIGWLFFDNVISISFEELIGENGGGNNLLQKQLIWSLQLKLKVDGKPSSFATQVFDKSSDTFFRGQVNTYKELLKDDHWSLFNSLDKTFMDELGYTIDNIYSTKINYFKNKIFNFNPNISFQPIWKETNFFNHYILYYKKLYYGIDKKLGSIDIKKEIPEDVIIDANLDILKYKIIKNYEKKTILN